MIFNSYYVKKYTEMRRKEEVAAARLEQLSQEIKGQKPRRQTLTGQVGDWLSELGYRLLTAAARAGQAGQRLRLRWRLKKAEGRLNR